jgi:hypothetical protein
MRERHSGPDAPTLEAPMRLWSAGRPLKRWRYVGVFGEEMMACAALVQVGPARQSFWALYLRGSSEMRERTHTLRPRGAVALAPGRMCVRERGVALDLELEEQQGWLARCHDGSGWVSTRKQAGIAARGTLALDGGAPRSVNALAVIDDTAGYHARRTEWWWSAGVGEGPDGTGVAWNLVAGVNDPPSGSERALWVAGSPHEAAPVVFSADLTEITGADGSLLRFDAESERARRENLLIVKSDYRAPFGTFSGALPGGIELARGLGVVEHQRALW